MPPNPTTISKRLRRLYSRRERSQLVTIDIESEAALPELVVYKDDPLGFCRDVLGVTLTPDQEQILTLLPGNRVKVNSGHGTGKGHPVDQMIDTPKGRCRFGDLKVGDLVFGLDGKPTAVTGVFPRGVLPIYRVTFDDHSSTLVDGDHLWMVQERRHTRLGGFTGAPWQVLDTKTIAAKGTLRRPGSTVRKWALPASGVVEYPKQEVPVAPYTLGLWLGDGTGITGVITTADQEIVESLRAEAPDGVNVRPQKTGKACGVRVYGLTAKLKSLGILGSSSHEKRVPQAYLENDAETRLAVLQGLMDTDGTVGTRGKSSFGSTSKKLVEQVMWLVRSLGGKASFQPTVKKPFTRNPDGTKKEHKLFYRATVRLEAMPLFRLTRKLDRLKANGKPWENAQRRLIASVEPAGEVEVRCISVAAKDHMYLTNDFIPTHNSFVAAVAIVWWFYTRNPSVIVTTAPKQQHVETVLWGEVRTLISRALRPLPNFLQPKAPKLWDHPDHWAEGMTAAHGESFQGRHRPSMLFIFDECHDDQTEVLTENGWVKFPELTGEERLLTMDQQTQIAEYMKPIRVVRSWYEGDMYAYKCPGADFCVTPGHKMLWHHINTKNGVRVDGPWNRDRMEDLCSRKSAVYMSRKVTWIAPDVTTFTLPEYQSERKHFPARVLDMDLWLEFLGWFCSEGSLGKARNGLVYTAAITQKDPAVLAHILSLCERLGFNACVYKTTATPSVTIRDMRLARWLLELGDGCLKRRVPDFIRHLSVRQINIFLDAYVEGDGTKYPRNDTICTSSPQMATGLHELCVKTGVDSVVLPRKMNTGNSTINGRMVVSSTDGFIVRRCKRAKKLKFKAKHVTKVPYKGFTYCAELPKHNLLYTRRNGRAFWSSNCEGLNPLYWLTTGTMFQPNSDHGWLAIGNPVTTASQSAVEDRAKDHEGKPKWKIITLSALNHPNIVAQLKGDPPPIKDAVSLAQVNQWFGEWADKIDPRDKRPTDIEWPPESGIWYRPSPSMLGRVLGIRPVDGVNTVWGQSAWDLACKPKFSDEWVWLHRCGITIGVDVAVYGDDNSVIHVRSGPLSLHHETHNGWGPSRISDRVKELCVEWAAWYNARQSAAFARPPLTPAQVQVIIELDGPGFAVLDNCNKFGAWTGLKVAEASDMVDSLGTDKYDSKRSEMWHTGAAKAAGGQMDLSRLPQDVLNRLQDQLLTPAYELLAGGTIRVEAKKDVKLRLRRSPDDADAMLVCYCDAQTWSPQVLFKND